MVNRDLSVLSLRLFQEVRKEEAAVGKVKRTHIRHPHPGVAAYPQLAERLGLVFKPKEGKEGEQGAEEAKVRGCQRHCQADGAV